MQHLGGARPCSTERRCLQRAQHATLAGHMKQSRGALQCTNAGILIPVRSTASRCTNGDILNPVRAAQRHAMLGIRCCMRHDPPSRRRKCESLYRTHTHVVLQCGATSLDLHILTRPEAQACNGVSWPEDGWVMDEGLRHLVLKRSHQTAKHIALSDVHSLKSCEINDSCVFTYK